MTTASAAAHRVSDRAPVIAFTWGLAEALLFFIVPDVFLTRVALRSVRRALLGCLWATIGAVIGGAALWSAANHGHAPELLHVFKWLPGISNHLIAVTGQATQQLGAPAMFSGAWLGHPYKLYAVHAGAQNVSLVAFIGVSIVARALRFAATTLVAWLIGRALAATSDRVRMQLHLLVWVAFYVVYFALMR